MDNASAALNLLIEKGYQITPEAFDLIKNEEDPIKITNKIIDNISKNLTSPLVLDEAFIFSLIDKKKDSPIPKNNCIPEIKLTGSIKFKPISKEVHSDIKILFDPTGKSYSTGKTEDFVKYFQDRYNRIKKIFLLRNDLNGLKNINELKPSNPGNEQTKIICMIMDKRQTKNGNIYLELEDLSGSITGIINKNNKEIFLKSNHIIKDQVLCFEGNQSRSGLFFINDFFWPNTSTQHKPKSSEEDLLVALISDTHIGSKQFIEKGFLRFIDWLKGKIGSEKQKEIAGKVKYIIIAGDLVDGIGVYPKQEEDLEILDIFDQYRKSIELLEMIPEYIEIIISPGNHDATRQAMPQPAIPKKYAENMYDLSNFRLIGNPSQILINQVNFLIYHGRSLDDIAASVSGASITDSAKLMKELLISRHLAPEFGNRSPISPEIQDFLVIENEPDVFHAGHVHINGIDTYRNILLVNSGTWQDQTSYQKSMGVTPTPCQVPLYNLKNNSISVIDFLKNCS